MSGPFKLKEFSGFGNSPAKQKEFKLEVGAGQGHKRRGKYIVDPDAPGYPGQPGYEPEVKRSDLDKKGQETFDKLRKN